MFSLSLYISQPGLNIQYLPNSTNKKAEQRAPSYSVSRYKIRCYSYFLILCCHGLFKWIIVFFSTWWKAQLICLLKAPTFFFMNSLTIKSISNTLHVYLLSVLDKNSFSLLTSSLLIEDKFTLQFSKASLLKS